MNINRHTYVPGGITLHPVDFTLYHLVNVCHIDYLYLRHIYHIITSPQVGQPVQRKDQRELDEAGVMQPSK